MANCQFHKVVGRDPASAGRRKASPIPDPREVQLCTHKHSRHRRVEMGGGVLSCGGDLNACQLESRVKYLDDEKASSKDLRDIQAGTRLAESEAEEG